ncbi:MAG: hypothetical protein KF729_05135 [Sandaracinaceae bacterium]|nr:hypothetical protein [Sandaracinaceae bacterium]
MGEPELGGSSGAPLFDEEGYVVGLVSAPSPIAGEIVHASIASLFSLDAFRLQVPPATERSFFALAPLDDAVARPLRLRATALGTGPQAPRAVAERPGGGFLSVGYATKADGQHAFALAGFTADGGLDPAFGGSVIDVLGSTTEELFDVAFQVVAGEPHAVAVGNLADPDSVGVLRLTPSGTPDQTFGGSGDGVVRITGGDGGASGAAILVDPTDQSLVVVGHAAVRVPSVENRLHGSPLVARLAPDGTLAPRCAGSGTFVWRPDSGNFLTAQTFEELVEGSIAPTYDMVVTDAALDSVGRIVLGGYVHFLELHGRSPWVGRLLPDCTPDRTFGEGGSGVHVFSLQGFAVDADNAWVSAVAVEPDTDRVFAAGTVTRFERSRGSFAGRMFVAAFLTDGRLDDAGFGVGTMRGGALVPRDAEIWHEEAHGIVVGTRSGDPGDELRVVVVGSAYAHTRSTTRRARVATLFTDGALESLALPPNPLGVVEARAVDGVLDASGGLWLAVAQRSQRVFDPRP